MEIKVLIAGHVVSCATVEAGGPNAEANRKVRDAMRRQVEGCARSGAIEVGGLDGAERRAWELILAPCRPEGTEVRRPALLEYQGRGKLWRLYLRGDAAQVKNSTRWVDRRTYSGIFPSTTVSEAMVDREASGLRKPGALRRVDVVLRGDKPVRVVRPAH